jgi:hypothetical protein
MTALALGCVAVLFGIAGLIWPRFARRNAIVISSLCLVAVLAILVINDVAIRAQQNHGFWLLLAVEFGVVIGLWCGSRLLRSDTPHSGIRRSLCLAGIGAGAVMWLGCSIDQIDEDELDRQLAIVASQPNAGWDQYVRKGLVVQTDLGHPVPLGIYRAGAEMTKELHRVGDSLEGTFHSAIIRRGPQDPTYDCHGWTFAAGRYHIGSNSVEQILHDNGYKLVDQPQVDDVIIYRDATGAIIHSGIVRVSEGAGLVLVESKWSVYGRYLHPPEVQVYSQDFAYYRSPRQGHLLAGLSNAPSLSPGTAAKAVTSEEHVRYATSFVDTP